MTEERTILTIIERAKKGDKAAFEQLIVSFEKQVFNLAFRILKNREDAEEVAQDTFIKAYKKIKFFRGDAKFSSWLYRITYNTSLNKIAANKRHGFKEELEDEKFDHSLSNDGVESLLQLDRKDFIKQALLKLSLNENTLLTLYYQHDCDLAEIEKITGINKNTAKVQLHRARKRMEVELRNLLKGEIESIR